MSMSDPETSPELHEGAPVAAPVSQPDRPETADGVPATGEGEAPVATEAPAAPAPEESPAGAVSEAPEPVVEEAVREVALQRSVRYGRILIGFALLGAVIGAIACTFYTIPEGAEYTLGQVVGFMIMIGGAAGLAIGALFALLLGSIAARKRGIGVAIQTDVR